MPLSWTATIYASTALFAIAAFVVRRHKPSWLWAYLLACVPAGVVWANQMWITSRYLRPVLLALQVMAVIEAICLLHKNCWNPRRRYWFAGFCGLAAIGGTFAAVEYPGYPKALWWAQLWVEVALTAGIGAALALFRWWEDFRPAGWTIGNAATMQVYCLVETIALLWPTTQANWIGVDLTLALVQDWCLLMWILLYSR